MKKTGNTVQLRQNQRGAHAKRISHATRKLALFRDRSDAVFRKNYVKKKEKCTIIKQYEMFDGECAIASKKINIIYLSVFGWNTSLN